MAETATVRPARLPLGKSSVTYRIAMEPVTVLASGPRALLLQVTHPVVAAGVAEYSDYEARPWSRLYKTLETMMLLAFGTPGLSEKTSRRLRRRHASISGELEDGTTYRALDPHNMVWVWATLLDTLVVAYERFVRPLDADERDRLYQEWLLIAEGCGLPRAHCPATWDDFQAYVERVVRDELGPTQTALTVASQVRRPPLPLPLRFAASTLLGVLGPGPLPADLRSELGFFWTPVHQALYDGAALASRVGARVTPGRLRRLPMALATAGPAYLRFPGVRNRTVAAA
ncbi:MAG: oxygenase MpaB family protein [Acidimicrobiales bacterium]